MGGREVECIKQGLDGGGGGGKEGGSEDGKEGEWKYSKDGGREELELTESRLMSL